MTLDDLEWPFRTVIQNTCVFGAYNENLNEDRPIVLAAKMLRMTAVSGNIRLMWIFAGVNPGEGPWRGGVKRQCGTVIENVDFQRFRTLRLRHLGKKAI